MARRIQKHSTRLSQAHESALDAAFRQGQRVQTIDGQPGRVLFISAAFAPGVTEYQVQLDNGQGEGTYTASQLRPVPDDYRGANQPLPPGLLPAGVRPMAAYVTEDQARQWWRDSPDARAGMTAEESLRQAAQRQDELFRLASDDYPEMGGVLHDRPDPGTEIRVIGRLHEYGEVHAPPGGLRRLAASHSYGGQDDPRDEDYNGGEADTGMYWAEPGQQAWMHENVGPQEEAPPPLMMAPEPEDLPGPLARLAQIEEAGALWGGTRHRATTINGTQIDGHGDAPGHGTEPRASEPNDYDGRSTEGEEDPKWDEPLPGQDEDTLEGATVGMYPGGVMSGGGPAPGIGAVVANVPWTGEQRTHLHSWDNGAAVQQGDFVSSAQFTNKVPVTQEIEDPAPEIIEQELRAQASMPQGEDLVRHLIEDHGHDYDTTPGMHAEERHRLEHTEGDPRDYQYRGHAHMHVAPYENNLAPWAGIDRPVARELEHERPWDRGQVMHTLSSQHIAKSEAGWADHLRRDHGFTDERIAGIRDQRMRLSHYHEAAHDAGIANHSHPGVTYDDPFPALPHMEGEEGLRDPDPEAAVYDSRPLKTIDPGTWPEDVRQRYLSVRQAGVRVKVHGPDDFTLHQAPDEHDNDANDLDTPGDKMRAGKADTEEDKNSLDFGESLQDPPDLQVNGPGDLSGNADDPLDNPPAGLAAPDPGAPPPAGGAGTQGGLPPAAWPMTQAPVQQGGPAFTQGTHDQHGRVFPPAPPAPAPDVAGGDEPGEDGEDGDGKKVQLEIKTAADADDEDAPPTGQRMQDALREHMRGESERREQRMHEQDFEHAQGWGPAPPHTERTLNLIEQAGGYHEPTDMGRLDNTRELGVRDPRNWTAEEDRARYSSLQALAAFEVSAASRAFRFEFTSSWTDVVAKAKRLRKAGRVRITHASHGMVIGEVGGDHDVYESGIQRAAGGPQTIQFWACGCPWGTFRQNPDAARQYKYAASRLNGRPCSHVMALQFEALARTRREQKVDADPSAADLGVPHQVVVKSEPPWTNGGWSKTWLAPAASRHTAVYVSPPEMGSDLAHHMENHHGISRMTLGDASPERVAMFHMDEHATYPGQQSHQHAEPEGLPGESHWPDLFHERAPYTVDEYGGASAGHDHAGERTLDKFYPLPYRESSIAGQECLYRHDGECPDLGDPRTAESLHHSRPRGFESMITPNPMHDPEGWTPVQTASHVMTGSVNGRLAGRLHFSQSDDGQAFEVNMLHSRMPGKGVASAMMDDLYSHVKANGRWLDHGHRTEEGNNWWSTYREPHPEINTHHTSPAEGWGNYWEPMRVAHAASTNFKDSGGRGAHTPIRYNPMQHPFDDRHEQWTHARGTNPQTADERMGEMDEAIARESPGMTAVPVQQATAALLAAEEDPDEVMALAMLAGVQREAIKRTLIQLTADQTNAPWGSENVTKHPPQKPYGATEPPNKDQSPASYGFLSAPDPDNWGSIQEDSAIQMPLTNTGAKTALSDPGHKVLVPGAPSPLPADLNYPDVGDFHEDQGSFGYTDRANTAGPSTSITPRDPGGIRMEESLDPAADAAEFRHHLVTMHGQPDVDWLPQDWGKHARDHEDAVRAREIGEPLEAYTGYRPHPYAELAHERRHGRDAWPDAYSPGPTAELHDEPEPALDPDGLTAEDFQDRGEPARQAAGIDGTAGDAQDIPHQFADGGHRGCEACGLASGAAVHHTAAADGTIGGGDAGSGETTGAPEDVAALGEFGAARRAELRRRFGTPMGDQSVAEGLAGGAQIPSPVTQEPGIGSGDEYLTPDDQSIQTIGISDNPRVTSSYPKRAEQQWSGGGADSDEEAVEPGQPQGGMDDIVASFQRSAAAGQYGGGGPASIGTSGGPGNGDIARAARFFLKTADALPDAEAQELIGEGKGSRARNLGLLRLEGTHYEDEDGELARRGLSLDDYDDDVISA